MSILVSFLSGIIAAFTPCVIVLMPILLYRYFHEDTKDWKHFGFFISGFLIAYIIFGYFLSALFTSFIQNGLKLGLGLLFIILGVLAIMGRLNPINFPIIKNSAILGMVFALIISLNPCTIPYLSVIITINNKYLFFSNLVFFGLGLIVPSVLFAFFGKKILDIGKRSGKLFHKINTVMHYILIASGFYLIYTIKRIVVYDIYVISLFLIVIFAILIKSFFIISRYKKNNFSLQNLLLFLALALMLFGAFSNCKSYIDENSKYDILYNQNHETYSCTDDILTCEVCLRCIYIFSSAALIGFIGILTVYLTENKKSN